MKCEYVCRNEKCNAVNSFDTEKESFETHILEFVHSPRNKNKKNDNRTYILICPHCGTENKITIDKGS